jgi:hypothetical protein
MKKMCTLHNEIFFINKKEFVAKWMNPEEIMLGEIRQSQKQIPCDLC